jgi:hypothetical protein
VTDPGVTGPPPEGPVSIFRLDPELLDAVVAGVADERASAALADQVATVLPWHTAVPNELAGQLTRLIDHLGGDDALLRWLDGYPGRPRLVARAYRLVGLLDQISAAEPVITALREFRDRTRYPPGLVGILPPDTDSGTLASVAQQIEGLLADDRPDDAVSAALATIAMLREVAPRAAELDPRHGALDLMLDQLRRELEAARRYLQNDGESGGR